MDEVAEEGKLVDGGRLENVERREEPLEDDDDRLDRQDFYSFESGKGKGRLEGSESEGESVACVRMMRKTFLSLGL